MNCYLRFVERFPKFILLFLFLITVCFSYFIGFLSEDSNPYLLPKDHPSRSALFSMRNDFTGTHDAILVAIYQSNSIINKDSLRSIFDLTHKFKTINLVEENDIKRLEDFNKKYQYPEFNERINKILQSGVQRKDAKVIKEVARLAENFPVSHSDRKFLKSLSERINPIIDVSSLAGSENIFLEPDGTLRAMVTVNSQTPNIDRVNMAVTDNELTTSSILSPDQKTALIAIEVSILSDDAEGQVRAYHEVNRIIEDYQKSHPQWRDEVYVGGVPVFFAEQKQMIDADMGTLFPIVVILVGATLAIFFRTILGVLIPLVNVIMCSIWTLGMMAIVGIPLDLITSVLPVFLITICSSDAIHMMAEYYRQKKLQPDQTAVVSNTLRLMMSPVILTTITTCVTFTVSTVTSITSLKNFGIAMSFGMFVAMIISLLLIPAWLSLQSSKASKNQKQQRPDRISRWLLQLLKPIMANRAPWLVGTGLSLVVLTFIATQVRIDDMGSAYFDDNNRFRIADEFINSHIAGTSPGWIEIGGIFFID